jgi:phosphoadenosine phosphosulfate reductase
MDRQAFYTTRDKHPTAAQLEKASTEALLRWAWEAFAPAVALSSSFQTQSVPLLHLVSLICPQMPILFIDTGFHFLETLAFRDELQTRLGLKVVSVRPAVEKSELLAQYGEGLYRRDPDLCCYLHKVEPLERAVQGLRAWLTGVRRDQTAHRNHLSVVEQGSSDLLKIHPMLHWSQEQIWDYIHQHRLPVHPLFPAGYISVGCAPCTRPVAPGEAERAGRWAGSPKTECGLHTSRFPHTEASYVQPSE